MYFLNGSYDLLYGQSKTNKQDSLRIEISQLRLVCRAGVNPKVSHARNTFDNLNYKKVSIPSSLIIIPSHSQKHYLAHNRLCTESSGTLSLFFHKKNVIRTIAVDIEMATKVLNSPKKIIVITFIQMHIQTKPKNWRFLLKIVIFFSSNKLNSR